MSTLPVVMFGNARGGILLHEFDRGLVVEQTLGEDARHGDVHADQVALFVFEMPGRVGAAGADQETAAIEHFSHQAVFRRLRRRLMGRKRNTSGRGCCPECRQPDAASLEKTAAPLIECCHDCLPVGRMDLVHCPVGCPCASY